jgi:hypothetical protein
MAALLASFLSNTLAGMVEIRQTKFLLGNLNG